MKKILLTALALVGLAAGALTLTAFRHSHDPARMERFVTHRVDDLLDDVAATDAQRQQIHAIADKVVADGKALRAEHQGAHKELLALWQADQPDAARVHALIDARAATMKTFADEVADAMLQVHGILTPEQRAKVTKKLSRHMGD
jgi:periplasmic protein CpxP/Spy